MKTCTKCGHEMEDTHLYCRNCGAIPSMSGGEEFTSSPLPVLEFETTNSPMVSSPNPTPMQIIRDGDEPQVVNETRKFKLTTKDGQKNIVRGDKCCLPCIGFPVSICCCAELRLEQTSDVEVLEVFNDQRGFITETKSSHCGSFSLNVDWGNIEPENEISVFYCIGCPKEGDNLNLILMSDGSIAHKRRPDLVIGEGSNGRMCLVDKNDERKLNFRI